MRNRYLDLLRAAAIVRVIVYHLFGWPWLSILLPAMGIMFALAGSLTAASLDKRGAGQVITSRLRRLLPPLWLLAAVAVPAMLAAGWAQEQAASTRSASHRLAFWLCRSATHRAATGASTSGNHCGTSGRTSGSWSCRR